MNIKDVIDTLELNRPFAYSELREAVDISIKALETVDKITEIIKIEQQATSCEHTKLYSFEMIEKIITDFQLSF